MSFNCQWDSPYVGIVFSSSCLEMDETLCWVLYEDGNDD